MMEDDAIRPSTRRSAQSVSKTGVLARMLLGAVVLPVLAACAVESVAQAPATQDDALEYPKWETVAPGENVAYNHRENLLQRGKLVYEKQCIGCHGEYGDGAGPASERLITQPRDFTSGIYKFRSTDSGSLPLEADLYRTITRGLARVSMPAFPLMPENEKVAVIEYIKTFYPQWQQRKDDRNVVSIPRPPSDLGAAERLARGRVVYLATQCWKCHGVDGRGSGATQTEYTDAWGNPQRAFDFTRGRLKGGSGPEEIYRTFHTGLRSIMPSFGGDTLGRITVQAFDAIGDVLDAEEAERLRPLVEQYPTDALAVMQLEPAELQSLAEMNSWDLVAYILSLRTETSTAEAVLGSARTAEGASTR
jgi:cytochrome c oxidase cbb3-type subunit 2